VRPPGDCGVTVAGGDRSDKRAVAVRNYCYGRGVAVRDRSYSVRGVVLLEVVIAIGLLAVGLAVIGAQFQSSYLAAEQTDLTVRGMMLAESKLAELDTGLIIPEELIEQDFGALFPEFAWRMRIEPTQTFDLNSVSIQILYDPLRTHFEEDYDFARAKVVQSLYTFRATPASIDLQRDFGLTDDDAAKLNERLPGGLFDVNNINPRLFADLDLQELVQILPALLEVFGVSLDEVRSQIPPELLEAFEQLEAEAAEGEGDDEGAEGTSPDSGGSGRPSGSGSRTGGGR